MPSLRLLLVSFGLVAASALWGTSHAYTTFSTVQAGDAYHDAIDAALGECQLQDFEGSQSSPADFTLVAAFSHVSTMTEARYIGIGFNSNVSGPAFWGNFDLGSEQFVVTGSDSFQILGEEIAGANVDFTFAHHLFEAENVCSLTSIRGTSDDFGFTLLSELATKFHQQDDGTIVLYLSQRDCRAEDDDEVADADEQAILDELCDGAMMTMFQTDIDIAFSCLAAYYQSGLIGFNACFNEKAEEYSFSQN